MSGGNADAEGVLLDRTAREATGDHGPRQGTSNALPIPGSKEQRFSDCRSRFNKINVTEISQ